MKKIKKYELIKLLELMKEKECITIDDIIKLLNEDLKNDDDVVFLWK